MEYYKILFAILTVLLTAFFASIIPRKLKERQKFMEDADKFYGTFVNQLTFLKTNINPGGGDTSNIGEYLRAYHVRYHQNAFEIFRKCLSDNKGKTIDKAWGKYCDFKQYSDKNNQKKARELALKNLEDVLKFAKHK